MNTTTITIHELGEYAIYNKDVTVAFVSPTVSDRKFSAFALGVTLDNLLPDAHEYNAQKCIFTLESGSRIHLVTEIEKLRGMVLHGVVFERLATTTRYDYDCAASRCRKLEGLGVRFLGR